MKKISILLLALFITFMSIPILAASAAGKVTTINLYGDLWGNSWKGAMLYRINPMPQGINYFTVRKEDIVFQNFLSMLLAAKHSNSTIIVNYDENNIDTNGYTGTKMLSAQ